MATLTIREAAPAEKAEALELICRAFEPISWFRRAEERFGLLNERGWRERFRARVEQAASGQTILLGFDQDNPAACAVCGYDPAFRLAFLDLLAVEPNAQGKGYGRAMLAAFEDWAQTQGAEAVNLDCLSDNDAGNCLYAAAGYEEVARQVRWFKRLSGEADSAAPTA
jgi:GNAT superfamily N-acetyltransferase